MLLQAYVYGRTSANHYLDEFWSGQVAQDFEFDASQRLFRLLQARHDGQP
jgi:hypothetical protein